MGGDNAFGPLLLLAAFGLLAYALLRGRRQQREVQSVQANLTPGTEVMTSSGLFATVVAVEDTVVTLETGPGHTSRWDRRAIVRVVPPPAGPADDLGGNVGGPDSDQDDGDTSPGRQ